MSRMAWAACHLAVVLLVYLVGQTIADRDHPLNHLRTERMLVQLDNNVVMTVSRKTFDSPGSTVLVTWKGVKAPHKDDYIGLYSPVIDPDTVNKTVPITYANCSNLDPKYMKTGAGSYSFQLLNLREDFMFALVYGTLEAPKIAAVSDKIVNKIPDQPTGGHLALHSDQRSLVVQWMSGSSAPQVLQYATQLYWKANNKYDKTAKSTVKTYTRTQMCGSPASTRGWRDPGYVHTAIILASKMKPGTRMMYRFGDQSASIGWSTDKSFIAPAGSGPLGTTPNDKEFKFLAFADMGTTNPTIWQDSNGLFDIPEFGENSIHLTNQLSSTGMAAEPDARLALAVGDLAYAVGYSANWDYFDHQYRDVLSQWPVAVAPGNHERDYPHTGDVFQDKSFNSGGECNVPYTYRWYTPANANYNTKVSYYSFNQGPVHFLMLDSETDSGTASAQGQFVAADLARVNRTKTPWVVAAFHRMMVAPSTDASPITGDLVNMKRLQGDYEDLFRRTQVDIVIQGHEHAYARTCPMYKSKCTTPGKQAKYTAPANGPIYILAGHAGAEFSHHENKTLADWVDMAEQDVNGYMRFKATAKTLTVEAIGVLKGDVRDTVQLVRS